MVEIPPGVNRGLGFVQGCVGEVPLIRLALCASHLLPRGGKEGRWGLGMLTNSLVVTLGPDPRGLYCAGLWKSKSPRVKPEGDERWWWG